MISSLVVNAQSIERYVISSLGGSYNDGASFYMDYTAGEVAVATISNANNFLTQGFQQPFTNSIVMVEENEDNPYLVLMYPNPVVDQLSIQMSNTGTGQCNIKVLDILGQLLIDKMLTPAQDGSAQTILDFSTFASGNYYIRIVQDTKIIQTGKVIKISQ